MSNFPDDFDTALVAGSTPAEDEAWDEGYEAAGTGPSHWSNPYIGQPPLDAAWDSGMGARLAEFEEMARVAERRADKQGKPKWDDE